MSAIRVILTVSIHASVKDATAVMYGNLLVTKVSIHASVKDATYAYDVSYPNKNVSIHASVKDATLITNMIKLRIKSFNPRICKRCDINITKIIDRDTSFNPRICKRCDSDDLFPTGISRFQSTHL